MFGFFWKPLETIGKRSAPAVSLARALQNMRFHRIFSRCGYPVILNHDYCGRRGLVP